MNLALVKADAEDEVEAELKSVSEGVDLVGLPRRTCSREKTMKTWRQREPLADVQ